LSPLARLAASVAAARAVAPDDARASETSPALRVAAAGDAVTVRQNRTGEQQTFVATVTGLPGSNGADGNGTWSPAMISADLTNPRADVGLSEMTERQRAVVEDGVRHRLIRAAFGHDGPPLDGRSANDILSDAVISAIADLTDAPAPSLTTRLNALLDLLELERLHVPFDAQTAFYDRFLASRGATPLTNDLAALALRLGFAKVDSTA